MRIGILLLVLSMTNIILKAQNCDEIIEYVKKEVGYGTTFTS